VGRTSVVGTGRASGGEGTSGGGATVAGNGNRCVGLSRFQLKSHPAIRPFRLTHLHRAGYDLSTSLSQRSNFKRRFEPSSLVSTRSHSRFPRVSSRAPRQSQAVARTPPETRSPDHAPHRQPQPRAKGSALRRVAAIGAKIPAPSHGRGKGGQRKGAGAGFPRSPRTFEKPVVGHPALRYGMARLGHGSTDPVALATRRISRVLGLSMVCVRRQAPLERWFGWVSSTPPDAAVRPLGLKKRSTMGFRSAKGRAVLGSRSC